MQRDPDALADATFDVLVVGGGINGTGVARDAARRGLDVALVEKDDFGYGTTSRSTRLIHGGIRYLELMDFGLVREALQERRRLLRNASHLVRPLEFVVPIYDDLTPGALKMRAGLLLYDLFSWGKELPRHGFLDRDEAIARVPQLSPDGLEGAALYHDAQVPDVERLCLENVLDAVAHGARVLNHAEVVDLLEEDVEDGPRVVGARVRDTLADRTFDVHARFVVNATGPWLDDVLDLADEELQPRLRTTKGIHLIVPPIVDEPVVLFATDGRLFFAIPWKGKTLIGTTDTDYDGDMDEVAATADDVAYLKASFQRFFPDADLDEVHYTWAGVRSLLRVEGVDESDVSRKHLVVDHGHVEDVPGLLSIVGGKITTHRQVAEEVVDLVGDRLGIRSHSDTRDVPLPGAPDAPLEEVEDDLVADLTDRWPGLPEDVARHLLRLHGTRTPRVLAHAEDPDGDLDPDLMEPLCPHAPDVRAQMLHAVAEEMAVATADVLLRRTTVGQAPCRGLDAAGTVNRYLAGRLGWSEAQREADLEAFRREVAHRDPDPSEEGGEVPGLVDVPQGKP